MTVILSYKKMGMPGTIPFDTPSDAMEEALQILITKWGVPTGVTVDGRQIANQDDLFLLWEDRMRAGSSEPLDISHC